MDNGILYMTNLEDAIRAWGNHREDWETIQKDCREALSGHTKRILESLRSSLGQKKMNSLLQKICQEMEGVPDMSGIETIIKEHREQAA